MISNIEKCFKVLQLRILGFKIVFRQKILNWRYFYNIYLVKIMLNLCLYSFYKLKFTNQFSQDFIHLWIQTIFEIDILQHKSILRINITDKYESRLEDSDPIFFKSSLFLGHFTFPLPFSSALFECLPLFPRNLTISILE